MRRGRHERGTILLLAILAILGVLALNFLLAVLLAPEDRGAFGDVFGLSNALFAGIALVMLGYTIYLQREEILIAREDLESSKRILDTQNRYIEIQIFEQKFFSLLHMLEEVLRGIIEDAPDNADGRPLFTRICDEIERARTADDAETALHDLRRRYEPLLEPAFALTCQAVRFIHRMPAALAPERAFYADILKARLPACFLVLFEHHLLHRCDDEATEVLRLAHGSGLLEPPGEEANRQ